MSPTRSSKKLVLLSGKLIGSVPLLGLCPDDIIRFDSSNGSTTYDIHSNNNNEDAIDTKQGGFY